MSHLRAGQSGITCPANLLGFIQIIVQPWRRFPCWMTCGLTVERLSKAVGQNGRPNTESLKLPPTFHQMCIIESFLIWLFACSSSECPLTLAVQLEGCAELIKVLKNGGAHLDFRTKDGITALHKAVRSKNHMALIVSVSPPRRSHRKPWLIFICSCKCPLENVPLGRESVSRQAVANR